MLKSKKYLLAGFWMGLFAPALCFGQHYSVYPTAQEYKSLPSYCVEKIEKKNRQENLMWAERFGADTWMHMHHYCQGLNDINRYYQSPTPQARKSNLSAAINQFDYVVGHIPADSVLLSEVLTNRGRVFLLAEQTQKGIKDLYKALELNPGNPQPYLALADEFQASKNKQKALQIVTDGLRYVPESKALRRRYKEFGGTEPYPEPIAKSQPLQAEVKSELGVETKAEAQSSKIVEEQPQESKPTREDDPPKIGSPKNPYCRFCPD